MSTFPLPLVMKAPINTHAALAQESQKLIHPLTDVHGRKHSLHTAVRTVHVLYVNICVCKPSLDIKDKQSNMRKDRITHTNIRNHIKHFTFDLKKLILPEGKHQI